MSLLPTSPELLGTGRRAMLRMAIPVIKTAGALGLIYMLASCGETEDSLVPTTTDAPSSATSATSGVESLPPLLVFDDLGDGSSIIQVFPGTTEDEADTTANGTYQAGDAVVAECYVEGGRPVESDPSVGEQLVLSNLWFRIEGTPGETQYATSTYTANSAEILEQVPAC